MESIREIYQKIKVFLMFPSTDLLIVGVIILVGFAGFGLGRLSVTDVKKSSVTIVETNSQTASVKAGKDETSRISQDSLGEVVASKNGSKYHFPWCSGAQRIADKNLISFSSIEEAQKAGYTAALNCKGLK